MKEYTKEDFEELRLAEFKYNHQLKCIEEERSKDYTTDFRMERLEEIERLATIERRQVYLALGLEEPDDKDIII